MKRTPGRRELRTEEQCPLQCHSSQDFGKCIHVVFWILGKTLQSTAKRSGPSGLRINFSIRPSRPPLRTSLMACGRMCRHIPGRKLQRHRKRLPDKSLGTTCNLGIVIFRKAASAIRTSGGLRSGGQVVPRLLSRRRLRCRCSLRPGIWTTRFYRKAIELLPERRAARRMEKLIRVRRGRLP